MLTTEATLAWKCLNGVVCVYKPSSLSMGCLRKILALKLTEGKFLPNFLFRSNKNAYSKLLNVSNRFE